MAPSKKQAVKKSKKSPSDDEIRQRIAEFEAVELRDMVNFPSESSLNSRTRPRAVPDFGTEIMADGRPFTSHYDEEAGRWEFSHAPRLINRNDYPTLESEHLQKIWGRWLVGVCFVIPLFSPFLVAIAMNHHKCNEALDVLTRGKVRSFGWEEIKWARVALFAYCCGLSVFAILAGTTHWWKL